MLYTEQDAQRAAEYVIYLRKSRQDLEAEKRGEMETLARHEKILNDVANEQGLKIAKVYKELVSGETIQDRPEMQQMMKEVYSGKYKGVLVVAADRLSRGDLENMGYILNGLKFSSTLLVTPGKTYDVANNKYDEQMLEMQLFNSKQEYRAIVGRMKEGKDLSIREGNFLASRAPMGYDVVKPDKWTRTLNPNKDAETIQKIFEWFVNDRMTCGQIAKRLTHGGVIAPGGGMSWTRDTIRHTLMNETYRGKIRWYYNKQVKEMDENGKIAKRRTISGHKYVLVEGKHPAIISEELFAAAQSLFTGQAPVKANTTIVNPLAGIMVCGKCGTVMRYVETKGVTRFAHAPNYLCKTKSAHVSDVMAIVCQSLREYIRDFEIKLNNGDRMEEAKKHALEIERVEKELEKAKAKRRRLFDDYENEVYTREEFQERKIIWADRIERMTYELEELLQCQPAEIDYQEKIVSFSRVLEALENSEVSAKEKNVLMKEIVERIEYHRENNGTQSGGKIDIIIKLK